MNKVRVGEEDIRRMVTEFYTNVRHDELLGPIFEYRFQGWCWAALRRDWYYRPIEVLVADDGERAGDLLSIGFEEQVVDAGADELARVIAPVPQYGVALAGGAGAQVLLPDQATGG